MPTAFVAVPARIIRTGATLGCEVLLAALPHGGQQGARRNAWGAMVDDHARSKMRREAERATAEAQARAARREPANGRDESAKAAEKIASAR